MDESINPKLINWAAHTSKRAQDFHLQFALYDILNTKDSISMLSFPAGSWSFEEDLAAAFPTIVFDFYGIEEHPKVHSAMRKKCGQLNENRYNKHPGTAFASSPKPQKLLDFVMAERPPQLDVAYLDWMGTWSKVKELELYTLVEKCRPKKLIFTVALARGYTATNKMLEAILEGLRAPEIARYDELIESACNHCRHDKELISGKKLTAIPVRAEDLLSEIDAVESVVFERGRVYDSVAKTDGASVRAEAFYVFNLTYK